MIKKPETKRQKESALKRKFIYDKSMELFIEQGYANTTISDISKATGISVGSIYHHYLNKEAILLEHNYHISNVAELGKDIEEKIKKPYDAILKFLLDYASELEKIGVRLTAQIFRIYDSPSMTPGYTHKIISYYKDLTHFIKRAQEFGTFDISLTAEEATMYLFTISRGLVYEWCLYHGSYSLREKSSAIMPRILKTFTAE